MFFEYILSAVILGIIVAIPPGSVTVVALQRSIQYGFKNSLFFTLGSCLSDIFYITLVFFGVSNLIAHNRVYKISLWIFCGFILIISGILPLISLKNTKSENKMSRYHAGAFATFTSGIFITLSNPLTIVGWIAIAGNFFLIWNEKYPDSRYFGFLTILLIMAGVLIWFIPLTFIVSRLRKLMTDNLKLKLIILSSICLIIFGVLALYYAVKTVFFLN